MKLFNIYHGKVSDINSSPHNTDNSTGMVSIFKINDATVICSHRFDEVIQNDDIVVLYGSKMNGVIKVISLYNVSKKHFIPSHWPIYFVIGAFLALMVGFIYKPIIYSGLIVIVFGLICLFLYNANKMVKTFVLMKYGFRVTSALRLF